MVLWGREDRGWKKWKTKSRFPTFPRAARDYDSGFCLPKPNQNQTLWTRGQPPVQSEETANIAALWAAERTPVVPAGFRIIIRLENARRVAAAPGAGLGTYTVGSMPCGIAFDGANIWGLTRFLIPACCAASAQAYQTALWVRWWPSSRG